jgi:hypothetical protein
LTAIDRYEDADPECDGYYRDPKGTFHILQTNRPQQSNIVNEMGCLQLKRQFQRWHEGFDPAR